MLFPRRGSHVSCFRVVPAWESEGMVGRWKKAVLQVFSGFLVLFLRKRLQISEIFLTRPRVFWQKSQTGFLSLALFFSCRPVSWLSVSRIRSPTAPLSCLPACACGWRLRLVLVVSCDVVLAVAGFFHAAAPGCRSIRGLP